MSKISNKKASTKEYNDFGALYNEAVEVGLLPKGKISNNKFSSDSPLAQRTIWYNRFRSFIHKKYGELNASKYSIVLTRHNFKACIRQWKETENKKEELKQGKLNKKKKDWGLTVPAKNESTTWIRSQGHTLTPFSGINEILDSQITPVKFLPTTAKKGASASLAKDVAFKSFIVLEEPEKTKLFEFLEKNFKSKPSIEMGLLIFVLIKDCYISKYAPYQYPSMFHRILEKEFGFTETRPGFFQAFRRVQKKDSKGTYQRELEIEALSEQIKKIVFPI